MSKLFTPKKGKIPYWRKSIQFVLKLLKTRTQCVFMNIPLYIVHVDLAHHIQAFLMSLFTLFTNELENSNKELCRSVEGEKKCRVVSMVISVFLYLFLGFVYRPHRLDERKISFSKVAGIDLAFVFHGFMFDE